MGKFTPKFFGPFYLINKIGKGGTAEVFLGLLSTDFDEKHPKRSMYAIKQLLPQFSKEKNFIECLTSEAKLASILQHPNIVSVSDLGNVGTDYYLSMEWINGKSLFDIIQTVKKKKKVISSHYLLYICFEVSKGIDYAHKAKDSAGRNLDIVHCDISPHNILISYSGKVKLSDFGIATAAKQKEQIVGNSVFGKIHYISPEQISHKGFDYRADIYSFGVLLYESLTFKKPFSASSHLELQNKIRNEKPDLSHPEIAKNKEVAAFIASCLEKDPNNRPASLAEFQDIYESTFSNQEVDQKKISRLMQHLLRDVIIDEKNVLKKRLGQYKTAKASKEQSDLKRLEKERSRDVVEHTEVLQNDTSEDQTKVLRKDSPKGELGKVALEKKRVMKVIPKAPIVEEITAPPHDMPYSKDEAIDGIIDESIFDVSGSSLTESDLEANVDLDEIKEGLDIDENEVTYVSNIETIDDDETGDIPTAKLEVSSDKDLQEFDDEHEASLPPETRKIDTDSFNMFQTQPAFEKTEVMEDSIPDYLLERPGATVEEVLHSDDKIIKSGDKNQVFFQKQHAPINEPAHSWSRQEDPKFQDMKPVTAFEDENTIKINIEIPKSILKIGIPLMLLIGALLFFYQWFQNYDSFKTAAPIEHIEVFVSTETNKQNLFKTDTQNIQKQWLTQNLLTPSQNFLRKQQAQHKSSKTKISLEIAQIKPSTSFVWEDSFFKPKVAYDHLTPLFQLPTDISSPNKGRLFLHLFHMAGERRMYPFQYSGRSPRGQHVAFLPINQSKSEAQVMLTHQILRLMGAKVLTNAKGQPLFPDGYADPVKKPLHPQPLGEIMTLMIPQSPTESYLLDNLNFAKVGETTAKSIGWK